MALTNLLISNNVSRNVTNGINVTGSANNVDIINNSFFGGTNAIVISGTYAGKAVNNAMDGNVSAGTGISVGSGSPTIDYNVVYSYNTAYGGVASAGAASFTSNPLFTSGADLRVKTYSPCIDSGAGSDTYDGVPSDDVREQARPVVISGYTSVDNGTDIGAYEMLAVELDPQPIFYVNASGSNSSPFDSSNSGALNFGSLFDSIPFFTDGDIIEVVQNGGTIDDSTNSVGSIDKNLTIRADSTGVGKSTIHVNDSSAQFNFVAGAVSPVVQNLILIKPGPDATSGFIQFGSYDMTSVEITGNEFSIIDTSGADAHGIIFSENIIVDGTVSNNSFDDLASAIRSEPSSDGGSVTPLAMHYSRTMRTRMTGVMVAPPAPS